MSTLYTFISRYGRKKPLLAGTYQQFEKSQYNAIDFVKTQYLPTLGRYQINPNISNQNKIPNVEQVLFE